VRLAARAQAGEPASWWNVASEPAATGPFAAMLRQAGLDVVQLDKLRRRAETAGTSLQAEIIAAGLVTEAELYRAVAAELDLPFVDEVDHETLVLRERDCIAALSAPGGVGLAMRVEEQRRTSLLVSPDLVQAKALLSRKPGLRERLRVVAPSALRAAFERRARAQLTEIASDGLFGLHPQFSARIVANAWQGALVGALLVGLPVAFALAPWSTVLALHLVSTLFFFACVALRAAVVAGGCREPAPHILVASQEEVPVYTVLVALYREADIVPQLLVSLGRLVWPRSRLEVCLVCESDDHETLAAIASSRLRPFIRVIEVPPSGPRTKPKALAYALPQTSGELVALYDAEDRPNPLQLIEAWRRFASEGEDLACVQAPLCVSNREESAISRMFWFEYSALFRGLLPWLSERRLLLPLGGTSNHFRRKALVRAGGWDPYNVTEDADLGIRLKRFGYRVGTISWPTREDGPAELGIWIRQRTRWFKGWLQTWLVHMRSPRSLYRDIGLRSFLIAQILFLGMVVSALMHPFLIVTGAVMLYAMLAAAEVGGLQIALLVLDVVNIVAGYATFLVMGYLTLRDDERAGFWRVVALTPLYWMAMSLAAWRALWQLYRTPHLWEKTPHTPTKDTAPDTVSAQSRKPGPSPMILRSSSPITERSRPS